MYYKNNIVENLIITSKLYIWTHFCDAR